MVDSNSEEDENAGSERESLSVTRRNLLKLAAAGAAVLGITGQSSGGANPNADDLQLPDELNLEKIFVPGDDQFALVNEDSGERVLSFDPSVGSFNLQGNSAFNLSQVQMGDTFRLPRTKTKMETLEKVRVGPEETKVLADLTGENIITSLWFATFGEARMGRDAILRVYTDGSSSPDLEMDVGTLWANHLAMKGIPLLNSTRHMSVGSNWSDRRQTHSVMNFPIPCSDGARIEIQNTHSSKVGYLYSQVTYREGATAPFRLKGSGANYLARDFVASRHRSFKMLEARGAPGWLIWTSSCVNARSNDSFMEADFEVYVDGEKEPSIKTSGWEDWYRSGFYYYRSVYSTPYMMCNARNSSANYTSVGLDLMELHGGLRYDSSMVTKLDLAEVKTDFEIAWVQLYYQQKDEKP